MSRVARVALVVCACTSIAGAAADAQNLRVALDAGPHYVGDAISIRITAEGFEEEPPPEAQAPAPVQGRLELVGVSPSVSQSITIINGRMRRTRVVTHVFQYRYIADRPGNVVLGPFRIVQGAQLATLPVVRLRVQDIPSSDDIAVVLKLPDAPIYVGERVPVTVEFTLERELQQSLMGYSLRVPLFDRQETFRFLDEAAPAGGTEVVLETAAGRLDLKGTAREERRGGKRYIVVSVTRTLVPLAAGRHDVPPTSISVEEGVRFRRDFFGGRRATQVRRWRAQDRARTIDVKTIPGAERPPSFAGAIGSGFTLDVTADRTVVQIGDPITLTFTLRGEGLEAASLPPLNAEGLLPAARFRAPAGGLTGEIEGDAKRFTAVVRVLDERVEEIPTLAYSWFDPKTQTYETTRSRPVALSVRSAQVVGAGDVETTIVEGGEEAGPFGEPAGEADVSRARSFALTGADLAIQHDPGRLLGGAGAGWGGRWLLAALYAGSAALVPLAIFDRRRRDVDPAVTQRRRVFAVELERVRSAGDLAPTAAVDQLAEALRRMLAVVPGASSAELDAFLGECDARRYAPVGQDVPLEAAFLERAASLAEGLAGSA